MRLRVRQWGAPWRRGRLSGRRARPAGRPATHRAPAPPVRHARGRRGAGGAINQIFKLIILTVLIFSDHQRPARADCMLTVAGAAEQRQSAARLPRDATAANGSGLPRDRERSALPARAEQRADSRGGTAPCTHPQYTRRAHIEPGGAATATKAMCDGCSGQTAEGGPETPSASSGPSNHPELRAAARQCWAGRPCRGCAAWFWSRGRPR